LVRVVVSFLLFVTLANATLLEEKIESFIGNVEYKKQKNLIRILFKDEKQFLREDNSVDDIKVLSKLKENGLLKLFHNKPIELNLSFSTKGNSLIFMRVINESLSSMGYNYFLTKRALKSSGNFVWDVVISTEHMVDPLILSQRLESRGCYLELVQRKKENEWVYKINSENIKIEAIKAEANRTLKLKKPIKPYWIDIEDMKSISFVSKIADRWHPSVVFYDNKLHIVKDYKKDSKTDRLKLKIPRGTKYVKITDLYTLDNIKRGISIYLKRR
jgi:hypothetical protein